MAFISPDSEAIRREIADRGITYLCHFTTLRNAASMIRMGSSELHFKGADICGYLKIPNREGNV